MGGVQFHLYHKFARFEAQPIQQELHKYYVRKSKWVRRIRKFLFQLGILRSLASIWPVWTYMRNLEQKLCKAMFFILLNCFCTYKRINEHYKSYYSINISYPLAYYISLYAPEKTILIPTMHYESSTFRSIYTEVFTKVAYIGFNTVAEQKLAERILGKKYLIMGLLVLGLRVQKMLTGM